VAGFPARRGAVPGADGRGADCAYVSFRGAITKRQGRIVADLGPLGKQSGQWEGSVLGRHRLDAVRHLLYVRPAMPIREAPMTDTLPDLPARLSTDPDSPFYNAELLARDIGIRFKGVEKTNVEEYCVSEGWVRVAVGNKKDRFGKPLTLKLMGAVEPYFRDPRPA
jgi:hypothetical protein